MSFENKANVPEKLLKPYNAGEVESSIYKTWEESGFFNPDICVEKGITKPDAKPFTIMMPPPNVTGTLHMGHALGLTVQDIAIRFNRMQGRKTLWLPGTDHAAIATQSKVEKEIQKKEGLSRHDLGREKMLSRINEFAQNSHDTIVSQVRSMGASCDWSREAFTMDEERNLAVRTIFKSMFDDKLIYRGHRIVNWDPKGQTTIADDEIVYEERKAFMYTFKYSKDFPIAISTTRPETKVGDTAVAVHPDDVRYKQYVGQTFEIADFCGVPLSIKIVADESVEPDFGTGALGVTPAHSMTDWDIADRHNLPRPQVINEYAKMAVGDERILGKKTTEAREVVVDWLRNEGLLEKEEEINQNISTAERTGGIVEPLPKLQWFIDVNKEVPGRGKTLKELMKEPVSGGNIKILPDHFDKTYFHWVDNLRDWCISRQIWYGHRIPVWYKSPTVTWEHKFNIPEKFEWLRIGKKKYEIRAGKAETWDDHKVGDIIRFTLVDKTQNEEPILGVKPVIKKLVSNQSFTSLDELLSTINLEDIAPGMSRDEYAKAWADNDDFKNRIEKYGLCAWELENVEVETFCGTEAPSGDGWVQDPDTLDTWFSSGLWTFSTLGWPSKTSDLETYHPTSLIVPAYEILFFWIARMILMTSYALEAVPFENVYLTGILRDNQGRKLSKSLGNGGDPIEVGEKFGTDAVRMSLIVGNTPGIDSKLDENKIKAYSKFANKIWNATRFVMEQTYELDKTAAPSYDAEDQQSIDELNAFVAEITKEMEEFKFYLVSEKLYHYFWHTFADVIIERSKKKIAESNSVSAQWVLITHLNTLLKCLHPFMPFITEEIWSVLPVSTKRSEGGPETKNGKLLIIESWPSSH